MKLLASVFVTVIAAMPLVSHAQGGPGGPPAQVAVASAEMALLSPTITVPGTVISRDDARLAAEVAGNIVSIAEVGALVAENEVIAKIQDALLIQQQVENEGLVGSRQARIEFLEREVERLRRLAAQNNAARSQLDQTESDLEVARNDLRVARARLAQIRIAVARTEIRAPFVGRITQRFVNPGEHVAVGADVVRLVGDSRLEVVARAPLKSVSYLTPGETMRVQSERISGPGTIRAVVPFGDGRSHMFEMRVEVPPETWIIGESVRVTVPTAEPENLLAVPRDALVLRASGTSVFRVSDNNKAERIPVSTGAGDGELISVAGGDLSPGDRVVIRGAERLREGQDVMVGGLSGGAASGPAAGS